MKDITLLAVEDIVLDGKVIPKGAHIVWCLDGSQPVFSVVFPLPNDPGALLNPMADGLLVDATGRSPSLLEQRLAAGAPARRFVRPLRTTRESESRGHLKLER